MEQQDVIIIGGGIIGGAIAYQLARYDLKMLLLEKNPFFADETSKVNSGIIHGGFNSTPGKIKAKLNAQGNQLWREDIFKHLQFPRKQVASLILAFNAKEMHHVAKLYQQGLDNKVPPKLMKILSRAEVLQREPHVNSQVQGALLCTSSWTIDPVKATLAFIGGAQQNGMHAKKQARVTKIAAQDDGFIVTINHNQTFLTKNIINAAGHYADKIAALANLGDFQQTTRRGEYRVLARSEGNIVNSICFMMPTIHGKGVIVAPMTDGRILVGPTAENGVPKADMQLVTRAKFEHIGQMGQKIVPTLKIDKTEIVLAGSRPIDKATNDFVIRHAHANQHFINAAGMQSPGIASAPAIALEIEKLLKANGTTLNLKHNFKPQFKVMW